MVKINLFSVSFGMIVKTTDDKVVIIRRKIPYCVQNFLMRKGKRFDINNYKNETFKDYILHLDYNIKLDYLSFCNKKGYEDQFDFPHGQMEMKKYKMFTQKLKIDLKLKFNKIFRYYAFMTAFKEFQEETGLTFELPDSIKDIPFRKVEFVGLDGYKYKQIYFMVTVDKLEKSHNFDRESFYEPLVINISVAKKIFKEQQVIKVDHKDSLLVERGLPIDHRYEK